MENMRERLREVEVKVRRYDRVLQRENREIGRNANVTEPMKSMNLPVQ